MFFRLSQTTTSCVLPVLLSFLLTITHASDDGSKVLSLTPSNYKTATQNKVVFIKFYAPWCGHCQQLAPSWEKLAADYADHAEYLIAQVDCTTPDTETWCEETFEIEGFPTLLFGDPAREGALLEEYQDDRDYESLAEFAEQMFAAPLCNVDHLDGCPEETKAKLQGFMRLSSDEIEKELERMENEMDQVEEDFEEAMDELQEQYDEIATTHQLNVATISKELRIMLDIKELRTAPSASSS